MSDKLKTSAPEFSNVDRIQYIGASNVLIMSAITILLDSLECARQSGHVPTIEGVASLVDTIVMTGEKIALMGEAHTKELTDELIAERAPKVGNYH